MIEGKSDQVKFNIFVFISTFAKSLIEIFISLYLFKNGFSIKSILTFYLLENFFAIFLSYIFVRIGERYKYSIVMYIGIASFIILFLAIFFIIRYIRRKKGIDLNRETKNISKEKLMEDI